MKFEYDEKGFWSKVKEVVLQGGRTVLEKALWLYYAAQRPETPAWAKVTCYTALAYFVAPVDAIPDVAPGVGFSDDLMVLASAITAIAMHIDAEVKRKAEATLKDWFG